MSSLKQISFFLCFVSCCLANAQYANSESLKQLDKLIGEKNYTEAQAFLKQSIEKFKSKKDYYLLTDYIYYTGKINLQLHNQTTATNAVKQYINTLTSSTDSLKVLRQAKLELSSYYELIGDSQKAYEANLEALKLTSKWKQATPEDFGLIENNLGTLSNRKGDIAAGTEHHRKALKHYESYPKTDKTNLYILYNSLGGSMWYLSKIDSALYFYEKADKILKQLDPDPMNSYYRPAIINNNIAGIYSSQGNLDKALEAMGLTITYLNQFIKTDVSDVKKESAKEFLYMSIENYAGIYKDIGDYEKAKELIEYSYKEKQKHFGPENPELFKAKILLGQIYLALKDYTRSEKYLDDAIAQIKNTDGGNNFWEADAHYYKASVNEQLGKKDIAKQHFEEAERLYEIALEGAYDELYLDFIINATHFYAQNNDKEKALKMAEKAYNYIKENQGSTTTFEIQQALNLGEIHYELGDYASALEKGTSTEDLLKRNLPTQTNPLDSTKIIFYKPQTILLKTQSAYKLNPNKNDLGFLKKEFEQVKEAISIVEQQKTLIGDENNVSILIDNNSKIFEFAKQLSLELYKNTHDKSYLNEVISLHESILYNRIRSRLNSRTSMAYANIPNEILKQEKTIKNDIKASLNETNNIEAFIKANTQWNAYLETLKKEYPKYYKLRFASISKSLKDIEQKLPENTTVVRYVYTENELFAVLISKNNTKLFKLNPTDIKSKIAHLQDKSSLFEPNFNLLNELYVTLWKPFDQDIKTDRVVIVPDRDLFNLNFEMLTEKIASSYKDLATNSLLSKYIISYNYSLFLIDKGSQTIGYKDNFVAFVPEFTEQMKSDYQLAIHDSLNLDKTYLTLLPQPFTKDLADFSTRLFKGTSFLNENSTERIFKNSAKEHKIIHIGTHAESNNISPELSRLVFAKSMDSTNTDDNYLYTYEIYNTNLSSNLAILTACETGKPTYQAGEGMISLAHAFNYAGSESILTSLWKIDEQSSAKIIESFL
ncbi:MAG: CHAT domain-containing tetratricopeptide repeat protein [Gelidibacter sp.]